MNENDELIKSYSELSLVDKRRELGKALAETTLITEKIMGSIYSNVQLKDLKEFENLYDSKLSEDDYLTGLYKDFIDMREEIAVIYNFVVNNIDVSGKSN